MFALRICFDKFKYIRFWTGPVFRTYWCRLYWRFTKARTSRFMLNFLKRPMKAVPKALRNCKFRLRPKLRRPFRLTLILCFFHPSTQLECRQDIVRRLYRSFCIWTCSYRSSCRIRNRLNRPVDQHPFWLRGFFRFCESIKSIDWNRLSQILCLEGLGWWFWFIRWMLIFIRTI